MLPISSLSFELRAMRMDDVQHGVNEYEVTLSREFSADFFFFFCSVATLCNKLQTPNTTSRARRWSMSAQQKKKKLHWNVSHGLIHLKRGKEKYKSENWVESLEVTRSKSFWQTCWRFSNAMQQREWRVFLLFDQFGVKCQLKRIKIYHKFLKLIHMLSRMAAMMKQTW